MVTRRTETLKPRMTLRLMAYALALLPGVACAQDATPPNVVLIVLDDFRTDDLRFVPELEELVQRGTTFSRAYASYALCTPSRASLLTGNLPTTHGVRTNEARRIPDGSTIATWFDAAGYTTAMVGKYANNIRSLDHQPPGWDVWQPVTSHQDLGKRQSIILGERMAEFVSAAREPFLLWGGFVAPHGPLRGPRACWSEPVAPLPTPPHFDESVREEAEAEWRARLERLCGLRMGVRVVLEALRRSGRGERTVIAVVSDQGYMLGEHGLIGKNVYYEPAIRSVLALVGPGIPVGRVKPRLVSVADLAPTLADLAGVPRPAVDGRNVLTGPRRKKVVIEASGVRVVRKGARVKRVLMTDGRALRFDLRKDPWEMAPREVGP